MKIYLTAILVGVICALPYVLPIFAVEYKGIPFIYQDNEELYLSRIREVTEGHLTISSPVLFEYKNAPAAQTPIGEWIYGFFATFIPLNFFIVFSKFLFPGILFLLIYYLVLRVNKNIHLALFVATACVLGSEMTRLSFIKEIFTNHNLFYLSIWTRLVNPITGGIFLVSFLHILLSLYQKNKWHIAGIAGVVLGLMTGYYFSFILACFILGFSSLFFLYKKNYQLFGFCIMVFLIGFLINIQYALNIAHLDMDQALKSGMILTHMPLFNKMQFLVLLCLIFRKNNRLIALLFFLSSIFALNLHVFTGHAIWPAHFTQYTNMLAIISIGILFSNIPKIFFKIGYIVIFLLSVITISGYVNKLNDFQDIQRRAGAFDWLRKNAGEECVVLSYEYRAKITWAVPAYTQCDSFSSPYVFSNVPKERIMYNFLTMLSIRGGEFDVDDMREYFFRDWRDLFAHQPDSWLKSITDKEEMNNYYTNLEKEIKNNYKDFNFDKKYRLDFIIWDSINASSTNPRKIKGIKQVFVEDGIFIFEI